MNSCGLYQAPTGWRWSSRSRRTGDTLEKKARLRPWKLAGLDARALERPGGVHADFFGSGGRRAEQYFSGRELVELRGDPGAVWRCDRGRSAIVAAGVLVGGGSLNWDLSAADALAGETWSGCAIRPGSTRPGRPYWWQRSGAGDRETAACLAGLEAGQAVWSAEPRVPAAKVGSPRIQIPKRRRWGPPRRHRVGWRWSRRGGHRRRTRRRSPASAPCRAAPDCQGLVGSGD